MLTPGRLRDVVASSFDLDARSVDVHLRNLREADLISKEKRGRGAARMTAADAAALVVATLGSQFVKDTLQTHEDYGRLKLTDRRLILSDGRSRLRSAFKKKLPLGNPSSDQTVLEVLANLFECDLSKKSYFHDGGFFPPVRYEDFTAGGVHSRIEYDPFLSVRFFLPFKVAIVEWGGVPLFRDARQYGEFPADPDDGRRWDLRPLGSHPGMLTVRAVGLQALSRISDALKSD